MNYTIKNPEFVKRMVVDSENLFVLRKKFFQDETLSETEIAEVIATTPYHPQINWGPERISMLPWTGLEHLHACIIDTVQKNIPGDFVETGAWRGGACILAKSIYESLGSQKKIFVVDSFEGLPPPDTEKYPNDKNDTHYLDLNMKASLETVQENFKKFGLLDDSVVFIKGWFKDTLPTAPIEKISILRLDGDMYESTIEPLETLYAKLSVGGYCIIDDYYHPACRQAIHDFRFANHITESIKKIDDDPLKEIHYWIKENKTVVIPTTYPQKGILHSLSYGMNTLAYIFEKGFCKIKKVFK